MNMITTEAELASVEPNDHRIIDAFIGFELTYYLVPEDGEFEIDYSTSSIAGAEENFEVFDGRHYDEETGEEQFIFGSCGETKYVPSWRIAVLSGDGWDAYCTSWQYGIDPRAKSPHEPEIAHRDPEDKIPIAVCFIHEH
jgi:hypothetical protein